MSLMDKMKNIFVDQGEDEYEDEDVNFTDVDKTESHYTKKTTDFNDFLDSNPQRDNKVVNIHATTQLQVILVKPEQFDEAKSIADHLNQKRTVVLNLESATKELSRRMVDFLSGVAYANNGQIKRVANSTFIITPYNVDIMGDLIDELENNGVYL